MASTSVGRWMIGLCEKVHAWSKELSDSQPIMGAEPTHGYIDLIFAYGLARLGGLDASRELLDRARSRMKAESSEVVHRLLLQGYTHRVKLAQEGKPNSGPLPADLMAVLMRVDETAELSVRARRYWVDRLREYSRILEPDCVPDAYAGYLLHPINQQGELSRLRLITDPAGSIDALRRLLQVIRTGTGTDRWYALTTALEVGPRGNKELAREVLGELISTYDRVSGSRDWPGLGGNAKLLERGMALAVHFDCEDIVGALLTRFQGFLLKQRDNPEAVLAFDSAGRFCLRVLRGVGMREPLETLLDQMADVILAGRNLPAVKVSNGNRWPAALRTLLRVAEGWLFLGWVQKAHPILRAAEVQLLNNALPCRDQTSLAVAYVEALSQELLEGAQARFEVLFDSLRGTHDTYTTAAVYNLSQLQVVEALVLAVVGE